MNYVIQKTKKKVENLEELINSDRIDSDEKRKVLDRIQFYKHKLSILEANPETLDETTKYMVSAIHDVNVIHDKYESRPVKLKYRVIDFLLKINKDIGNFIKKFATMKY